jgi:RNA 2',3'-cyclic 3'-phosphodiesterase
MARDRASRPEAKPIRLFVAVDVPDEVKAKLVAAVAPYRDRIPGARWTRSDGWHVTLKFLGATWPRLVDTVHEAVRSAAADAAPFRTRLTEMGVFPSPGRARVVWAGLEDAEGRFDPMVKRLDDLLEEHFVPEARAFTPHLTLARLNPPRSIREFVPELVGKDIRSEPFSIDRLALYRSHLSPKGATYEPLLQVPLGGG